MATAALTGACADERTIHVKVPVRPLRILLIPVMVFLVLVMRSPPFIDTRRKASAVIRCNEELSEATRKEMEVAVKAEEKHIIADYRSEVALFAGCFFAFTQLGKLPHPHPPRN